MRCHSGRLWYGEPDAVSDAIGYALLHRWFGFRVCSPYRHGRDRGTPKPGKKKQKRYDYACAVLIIHRFPFSLLLTLVLRKVRLEVTPKAKRSEQRRRLRQVLQP